MASNRARPCPPHYGAENHAGEDYIVGVADHGYEIGDQVHRKSEICKQKHEPDARTSRQSAIRGKPPKKAQRVRQDAGGLAKATTLKAGCDKESHESYPGNQQGDRSAK